ncbi:sugar phosphate isomerase/epimerase family protein [Cohnella caldifontis]|uniref:sugar phosphate isomerase/epimerase family protein n=1 Tax=Cohnella caldifontis TaxID=3027471 RepID=UPI0023EBB5AA|nr:sugar phosphate isomerase/epimerase [Cohnella sp. YIM B05605]
MSKPQVGIQLYSVRDLCAQDFLGTIRKIGDIGYKNVELAGNYGVAAKDLRKALDDAGLNAPSAHVGLTMDQPDQWQDNLKASAEYYRELGIQWFVVPWFPLGDHPDVAAVNRMADVLEQASEIVASYGMKFGYHNHAFEFQSVDGKLVIDRLLERIPADKMLAEFDLGWVKVGGQDPAAYVNKYASRLPLVHAKDFKADGTDTEIGRGSVDWDSALAACEKAGVQYVIIEQERYDVGSLESAKLNFEWFRARGWA